MSPQFTKPLPRATFIRASAGTGKTFQLSNRYLRLLIGGERPDSILASTFTRKAAGEILERVIQRLALAAAEPNEARSLAGHLEAQGLDQEEFAQHLRDLLRRLDRCRISTLDAFYSQLARTYCLELGLPPAWTILDDTQITDFRAEAIRRTLAEGFAGELIHLLAKGETKRTVSSLATNTVEELYAFFLDSPSVAWEKLPELAPLSAERLEGIVDTLQHYVHPSKSIGNALSADVLEFEAGRWDSLLSKGLGKPILAGKEIYNKVQIPDDLIGIYRELGRHLAALKLKEHRQHLLAARALLETYHKHFVELKRSARGMEFGDVTRALDAGWQRVREIGATDREETPLRHWLLDEFQDTNPSQWRSLAPLVSGALAQRGSLMVVGDTKQAIYGWRGGDARLFDSVEQLCADDRETKTLDVSRRSAQAVLDVVNQIFDYAAKTPDWEGHREGAAEWTSGYVEHRSAFANRQGYASLHGSDAPLDRAVEIASELYHQTKHCSIALLVRNNDKVGELIERLTRAGIPASEEAGKSIADSSSVQVVLSALQLIDHPADSIARFHVAATPLGAAWGLQQEPEASRANERLVPEIAALQRAQLIDLGYGRTIETWVQPLLAQEDSRERKRLEQLVDLAFRYQSQATLRPSDFIRYIETTKVSDPSSERVRVMNFHQSKGLEFDAVIIPDIDRNWIGQRPSFVAYRPSVTSSIDAIGPYISGDYRSLVPKQVAEWTDRWEAEQIGESLSMFYVALTRAARALYLVAKPLKANANLTKWSALIVRALRPGEPIVAGRVVHEHGDPEWFKPAEIELAEKEKGDHGHRQLTLAPLVIPAGEAGLSRNVRSVSPSSREGGFKIRVSDLFRQGNVAALIRGTAIHALFEAIEWLDGAATPSRNELQQRLATLEETPADSDQVLDQFEAMLRSPATRQLLNQSAQLHDAQKRWSALGAGPLNATVSNEHRFVLFEPGENQELHLCRGSIDRLVRFEGNGERAAMIIDYKTDAISANDPQALQERVAHYRPQVVAYRQAVARLLKLPQQRIASLLAFVELDQVVEL